MPLDLFVSKRAAGEIERIAKWWAENRQSAPDAVAEDLQHALNLLRLEPDIGSIVVQASAPGVRRFHLDRIRYWVYYRVQGTRLQVLSVWHSSRGRGPSI